MKALLLIGGKSLRMGKEKYLLKINGSPQYQHIYKLLSRMGLDVFLSCHTGQADTISDRFKKITDRYDGTGPMGGLASAIEHDPNHPWLVLACDLINLKERTIQNLLEHFSEEYDIITYQAAGCAFPETTVTIYTPSVYPMVKEAVEAGNYKLQAILAKSYVKYILPANDKELFNANRPDDLL